ncbi:MAG: TIGR00730 family Rossman fold protein [Bacteroidetes bacterium]|nr:TIGR00730 family Rossman fold protein [Bacteroidota bacterium]MCL2302115.1 TIGR00730 family Rossman fold protein [Lentimicrobiaceae bacterium]
MKINSIALFCGSADGFHSKYKELAAAFGQRCAQHHITLYYGGAALGLMKAAADACRANNGKVVGIAPSFFSNSTVIDTTLDELYLVDSMSERKQMLERCADAIVALPGSYGTMDEFFETLTDAQLGLHHKPVAILNAFGYYSPLIEQLKIFQNEGFLRDFHFDLLIVATTLNELFDKLEHYENSNDRNWLDKIKN